MTKTISLQELAETDLGQEIIRQRDARQEAQAEEAEVTRLRDLAAVEAEFAALAPSVLAGRERTLALARDFVEAQQDLNAKYQSLNRLKHRIRTLGGTYAMPPRLTAERATQLFLRELAEAVASVGQAL